VREEGWGFSQHDQQLFDVMGWFKLRYLEQLQIGYEAKAFSEFIELYSIRCKKGGNVSPSTSPMRVSRPRRERLSRPLSPISGHNVGPPWKVNCRRFEFSAGFNLCSIDLQMEKWHSTRFAARRRSKSNPIGKTSSRRGAHGKIIWIGTHRADVASAMSVQKSQMLRSRMGTLGSPGFGKGGRDWRKMSEESSSGTRSIG
jgi:hypothetical protein